jgi:predicted nuclease of predicted toxin-antitoxin system
MRLLANENFPLTSTRFLREKGYDVVAIGTDFVGFTDPAVIALANSQSRTILTFDADYGELIFKHGLKPDKGVIYLRLLEFTPSEPGEIIHQILSSAGFQTDNTLTVVEKDGIRQRKY